jgi:hypothetical protein
MNKYFLICLISVSLIIYTNSEDCSTLDTDEKCEAQSGCKWTETATCTGDASCTSETASKNDCEAVTYGAVTCTFNAGTESCTATVDGTNCEAGTDSTECAKIPNCAWTKGPDTCTGGTSCTTVTNPTSDSCRAASVAATKCTYTAAGCSGEAAGGGEGATPEANAYGGACTVTGDTHSCTDKDTQTCTNSKCVCKDGYGENAKGDGCVEIVAYGADCTNKACAASQTCDSNNKCVCATGYKENSDKSGCEKDNSSDSYSPFIKNSLMILLGITVF